MRYLPKLLVCGSFVLLCAALVRLVMPNDLTPELEDPSIQVSADHVMHIELEPIESFSTYYVNHVNPFLPHAQRRPEELAMNKLMHEQAGKDGIEDGIKGDQGIPLGHAVNTKERSQTDLQETDTQQVFTHQQLFPQLKGHITKAEESVLLLVLGAEERALRLGERIGDWTFFGRNKHAFVLQHANGDQLELVPRSQTNKH